MLRRSPKLLRRIRGDILLGHMFFVGIIAAIAIPAYQDYTIRSQVTEGLNLASSVKIAVAESFAKTGAWPANLKQLEFAHTPRGRYVASVTLRNGTVFIVYGGAANALLKGHVLTLRPTASPQGEVVWSCGYVADQGSDPRNGAAAPHATDLNPKFLPKACRG
jgi:type IV pilus assembly protein PilA